MKPNGGLQLRAWTTILCLAVTFPALAGTWTIETVVGRGYSPSLAYDPSDGSPSIAYQNRTGGKTDTAQFVHWDGSRWVIEEIGPMATGANEPDLAYNTVTGQPAVVYLGPVMKNKLPLIFATRSPAGTWTKAIVASEAYFATLGRFYSLAFDQAGVAAIVYSMTTRRDSSLYYARKDGATWLTQTVATANLPTTFADPSLAFDPAGNPAIAHGRHIRYTSYCLAYQRGNGSYWDEETVECGPWESYFGWGQSPSLAFSPGGEPSIVSVGGGYTGWPRYSHRSGAWMTEIIDESATATGQTLLAFSPAGVPYVSFTQDPLSDGSLPNEIRVAHLEGSTWVTESVVDGSVMPGTSLAIDSSGEPSVAYQDGVTGELKLARRATP